MRKFFVFLGLFLLFSAAGLVLSITFDQQGKINIDKPAFEHTFSGKQELIDEHLSELTSQIRKGDMEKIGPSFYSGYCCLYQK